MIFVFGSNTAGRHGKGAALDAKRMHGAVQGVAEGLMGNSYALPTCNARFKALPIEQIEGHIGRFARFVFSRPDLEFKVTRIGCGLAGLSDNDIAPYFVDAPPNCLFDTKWTPWLGDHARYWGTF